MNMSKLRRALASATKRTISNPAEQATTCKGFKLTPATGTAGSRGTRTLLQVGDDLPFPPTTNRQELSNPSAARACPICDGKRHLAS